MELSSNVNLNQPAKVRWGELEEDNGEDLDFLLPQLENARLSKGAVERRSWSKFGDAVHEEVGSRLTVVSTEEIILERPRPPGTNAEEPTLAGDSLPQLNRDAVLVVCRTCGNKGDHRTSTCPYKDLAPQSEDNKPVPSETTTIAPGPSKRAGGERTGTDKRRRKYENSVRVANLSEFTREADLYELCRPFGAISRVYVVIDGKTGISRGIGFVNFVNREEGERSYHQSQMGMVTAISFSETEWDGPLLDLIIESCPFLSLVAYIQCSFLSLFLKISF